MAWPPVRQAPFCIAALQPAALLHCDTNLCPAQLPARYIGLMDTQDHVLVVDDDAEIRGRRAHRVEQEMLVVRAVRLEPFARVVPAQASQERERLWRERRCRNRHLEASPVEVV